MSSIAEKNVLGTPLQSCCTNPLTGFYRDGRCVTGPQDSGKHVICAQVTEDFLLFSLGQGNDLINPVASNSVPAYDFPGLKPGDRWCLCASRWQEAYDAGVAPPVVLKATHEAALQYVSMEALQEKRIDGMKD